MSKVRDFNLLKVADVSSNSTNTNSVSVVVNTDTTGNSQNTNNNNSDINFTQAQPIFPTVINQVESGTVQYPSQSIQPVQQVQELQDQLNVMDGELRFYKLLSSTLSNILANDDPKLLINLIDQTGKIIIEASKLIELIAIKTNTDKNLVNIQFIDVEPTCLSKISPIKEIANIKIDNENFNLKYNKQFNILQDEYKISLNKCIISDIITYGKR